MPRLRFALTLTLPVLAACSTIVGAEFDDLHERPVAAGSGGTLAARGGSGGKGGSISVEGGNGGEATGGIVGKGGGGGRAGEQNTPGGASGTAGSAVGGGGTTAGAGAAGTAGGGQGGQAGSPTGLVINEVKGHGPQEDFIELYNRGPDPINLKDYGVSDKNNTFLFPDKNLAGHGYMLILLDELLTPGEATCFTSNPCYHQTWGVSATGETVSLRDPDGKLLDTTSFPGETSLGATDTWCRLPNGSGNFAACKPTPEADNLAP